MGGKEMGRFKKGQSTLEYVIILAAVVGAIIAVAAMFKPKLEGTYSTLTDKVKTKVDTVTF
jgi:Flp pilus assembly pilin Flp